MASSIARSCATRSMPTVPVVINTFYPPNQPTVAPLLRFRQGAAARDRVLAERCARRAHRLGRAQPFRHRRGGRRRRHRRDRSASIDGARRAGRADLPGRHVRDQELGAGRGRDGRARLRRRHRRLRAVLSLDSRHRQRDGLRPLAAAGQPGPIADFVVARSAATKLIQAPTHAALDCFGHPAFEGRPQSTIISPPSHRRRSWR